MDGTETSGFAQGATRCGVMHLLVAAGGTGWFEAGELSTPLED